MSLSTQSGAMILMTSHILCGKDTSGVRRHRCTPWVQYLGEGVMSENSIVKINNILMYFFLKIEINAKIHGEHNVKILNIDKITISDFSFSLMFLCGSVWHFI